MTKTGGGMNDHVPLLFQWPATLALAKAVSWVKTSASKWRKQLVDGFDWQEGYGAFSVSASQLQSVVRYINNQGSYHKKITLQREYWALLKKHGVDYDPRYGFG
jgi:putative transposase